MADETGLAATPDDAVFATNRAVADSVDAENARMKKQLGWEDPPAQVPLPQPTDNQAQEAPKGAASSFSSSQSSDAVSAIMNAPSTVVDGVKKVASIAGSAISAVDNAIANPAHTAAGIADIVSKMTNSAMRTAHAFQGWAQGNGFDIKALPEEDAVDYGSAIVNHFSLHEKRPMMVDQNQASDQIRARNTGKFVGQIAEFVAGGAVAGEVAGAAGLGAVGTGIAKIATAGAVNMLAFDPHEEGLSDYMQKSADMRNAVAGWFAHKPGEQASDVYFKNFLAGALGEGLAISAFHAFDMYKTRRLLNPDAMIAAQQTADEAAFQGAKNVTPNGPVGDAAAGSGEIQPPKMIAPPDNVPASEAALQAAEGNAGSSAAGNKAPPIGKPPEPTPSIAKNIELQSQSPIRYADQKNFDEFMKKVNGDKYHNPQMAVNLSNIDPAAFKAQSGTWAKWSDQADKLIADPEWVRTARATEIVNSANPQEVVASAKIRDFYHEEWEKADIALADAAQAGLSEKELHALNAKSIDMRDEFAVWGGITENKGGIAGQTLNAVQAANASNQAEAFRKVIADADMTRYTDGDINAAVKRASRIKEGKALEAAGDPKFVQFSDRLKSNVLQLFKGNKVTNMVEGFYINAKLSNPMTEVINVLSMNVQSVLAADEKVWTNRAAKLFGPKEFVPTVEGMATDFGVSKSEVKNIPLDVRENYRKYKNWSAVNADAGKIIESQAVLSLQKGITEDVLQLRGLGKDNKFVSGVDGAAKTGTNNALVRTHTMDELLNMNYLERAAVVYSQVTAKGLLNAPSQMMGVSDAIFTAIPGRIQLHTSAMRFAQATAPNPTMIEEIYQKTLKDPPPFIKQEIIDAMDRANFTPEIEGKKGYSKTLADGTKEIVPSTGNPVFAKAKELIESTFVGRMLVPFRTVAINAAIQAIDSTPAVANLISNNFRVAMEQGGTARNIAIGRMLQTSEIMAFGAGLYAAGVVTGGAPKDPATREAFMNANPNWQEYSLKYTIAGKDHYMPLRALEGQGKNLKFAAQIAQFLPHLNSDTSKQEWANMALAGIAITADQINPSFLVDENQKISEFIKNPSGQEAQRWLAQKMASVGTIEAARAVRKITDAERRRTDPNPTNDNPEILQRMVNEWKNAHPFTHNDLVPFRNIWGDSVEYSLPLTGTENTSPIAYTRSTDRTVENEVVRLGMTNPFIKEDSPMGDKFLSLQMPRKSITVEGATVSLTPKEYDDYVRLSAGDYTVMAEHGLMKEEAAKAQSKQNLRQVVLDRIKSKEYQALPDKWKRSDIREIVKGFRGDAKDALIAAHKDLQKRINVESLNQQEASLNPKDPAIGQIRQQKMTIQNSRKGITP